MVLSGGAPGTLAGFASLIFFSPFKKLNQRKSIGNFSEPHTGYLNLPTLLFRKRVDVKIFAWKT